MSKQFIGLLVVLFILVGVVGLYVLLSQQPTNLRTGVQVPKSTTVKVVKSYCRCKCNYSDGNWMCHDPWYNIVVRDGRTVSAQCSDSNWDIEITASNPASFNCSEYNGAACEAFVSPVGLPAGDGNNKLPGELANCERFVS